MRGSLGERGTVMSAMGSVCGVRAAAHSKAHGYGHPYRERKGSRPQAKPQTPTHHWATRAEFWPAPPAMYSTSGRAASSCGHTGVYVGVLWVQGRIDGHPCLDAARIGCARATTCGSSSLLGRSWGCAWRTLVLHYRCRLCAPLLPGSTAVRVHACMRTHAKRATREPCATGTQLPSRTLYMGRCLSSARIWLAACSCA